MFNINFNICFFIYCLMFTMRQLILLLLSIGAAQCPSLGSVSQCQMSDNCFWMPFRRVCLPACHLLQELECRASRSSFEVPSFRCQWDADRCIAVPPKNCLEFSTKDECDSNFINFGCGWSDVAVCERHAWSQESCHHTTIEACEHLSGCWLRTASCVGRQTSDQFFCQTAEATPESLKLCGRGDYDRCQLVSGSCKTRLNNYTHCTAIRSSSACQASSACAWVGHCASKFKMEEGHECGLNESASTCSQDGCGWVESCVESPWIAAHSGTTLTTLKLATFFLTAILF